MTASKSSIFRPVSIPFSREAASTRSASPVRFSSVLTYRFRLAGKFAYTRENTCSYARKRTRRRDREAKGEKKRNTRPCMHAERCNELSLVDATRRGE